jgi:hypothetical protein
MRLALGHDDEIPSTLMLRLVQERFWNWYAPRALERAARVRTFPDDVAMFAACNAESGDVTIYFTPNASVFAHGFDEVQSCEPPAEPAALELTVGDVSAWKLIKQPRA